MVAETISQCIQYINRYSATEVFLAHTGAIQIRLLLLLLLQQLCISDPVTASQHM